MGKRIIYLLAHFDLHTTIEVNLFQLLYITSEFQFIYGQQ